MYNEQLFKKNLKTLKGILEDEDIESLQKTSSNAIISGSLEKGNLNIISNSRDIYPANAQEFCEKQVDHYLKDPHRILTSRVKPYAEYNASLGMSALADFYDKISSKICDFPTNDYQTSHLILLGLGCGLHIEKLIDALNFKNLVIFEPQPDFWHISLQLIDWSVIVEKIKRRHGQIIVVGQPDPHLACGLLLDILRKTELSTLNGSYYYPHYDSDYFEEMAKSVNEAEGIVFASNGWEEDETCHLLNIYRNFQLYDMRLLDLKANYQPMRPAFIVGSGPSLNDDIKRIKRMRRKAVIFSGGTSLGILLKNGIVPDFHCELENHGPVEWVIDEISQQYDLSNIIFIGSVTTAASVGKYFGKRLFYMREGRGILAAFTNGYPQINGSVPTCTNVGFASAIAMNFKNIYFFGIDLGSIDKNKHHAKGSSYYSEDEARNITIDEDGFSKIYYNPAFNIQVQGNFGNIVYSDRVLIFTRQIFERELSKYSDLSVYNCSNGAKIRGTIPIFSDDIRLNEYIISKGDEVKNLFQQFNFVPKGSFIPPRQFADFIDGANHVIKDILLLLDKDYGDDFVAFQHAIEPYAELPKVMNDNVFIDSFWGAISGTINMLNMHSTRYMAYVKKKNFVEAIEILKDCYRKILYCQDYFILGFASLMSAEKVNNNLMNMNFIPSACLLGIYDHLLEDFKPYDKTVVSTGEGAAFVRHYKFLYENKLEYYYVYYHGLNVYFDSLIRQKNKQKIQEYCNYFHEIIEFDSDNSFLKCQYAYMLCFLGQYDKALAVIKDRENINLKIFKNIALELESEQGVNACFDYIEGNIYLLKEDHEKAHEKMQSLQSYFNSTTSSYLAYLETFMNISHAIAMGQHDKACDYIEEIFYNKSCYNLGVVQRSFFDNDYIMNIYYPAHSKLREHRYLQATTSIVQIEYPRFLGFYLGCKE